MTSPSLRFRRRQGLEAAFSAALAGLTIIVALALPAGALATQGWTLQNSGHSLFGVAFWNSSQGCAVGYTGTTLTTADGGGSWVVQDDGQHGEYTRESVAISDATHYWATTGDGALISSADAGVTWSQPYLLGGTEFHAVTFANASDGWLVGYAGEIDATIDGGLTWQPQRVLGDGAPLDAVSFADSNHGWAAGTNSNILGTVDGGVHWTLQHSSIAGPGTTRFRGVASSDPQHAWAVGDSGYIMATTDGGTTWTAQMSGTTEDLYAVAFADSRHGWAVGRSDTIIATMDGGQTWTHQPSRSGDWLSGVACAGKNDAWVVGRNGTILRTSTGGWPLPSVSDFTPSSGAVGASVTISGNGFSGATVVTFGGVRASFKLVSDTLLTAAVPLGARTGQVAVTGPGASGSSTADFTVVATHARLSFKLGGLTNGGLHIGQKVAVSGAISPLALAGSKVTVTIQKKSGARWATAKSLPLPTSGAGVFRSSYKPFKSGSYRARASIAGSNANTAAETAWKAFTVN